MLVLYYFLNLRVFHKASNNLFILVISLIVFAGAGLIKFSPKDLLIIIVVLFVHETGHFLAMKLFKYSDVKMFFLPFIGAAVSGKEQTPYSSKKALVSMAGPLPGLIIGLILVIAYGVTKDKLYLDASWMFIFINAFNLLPLYPMDGGRYFDSILFSRNHIIDVIFKVVTSLLLIGIAVSLQAWILIVIPVGVLLSLRYSYFTAKAARAVRKDLSKDDIASLTLNTEIIRQIRQSLNYNTSAGRKTLKNLSLLVEQTWERIFSIPPGAFKTFLFILVYIVSIGFVGISGITLLFVDAITGSKPSSVFIADLDRDGDNDLAVANRASNNVSVLLNNGDGTFADKVDYGTGDDPRSVFSVDLDGDRGNDLAVANAGTEEKPGNTLSVLLNNGDGTFAPKVDNGVGGNPSSVFSADLDGDGDNDLAVANSGFSLGHTVSMLLNISPGDTVSVLLNNGDGTFAPKMDYGTGDSPSSVFSADLDGDGDNDLAVANWHSFPNSVSVLLNNGDGTFAAKVGYSVEVNPSSVFSVDLDGDRDNDLAVANWNRDNVSVLLNNGDGTFAPKVDYDVGSDPASVLLNNRAGTFAPKVDYSVEVNPSSVFSVDLDGDRDNDLAVANGGSFHWPGNTVSVFLNNGDGTFATNVDYTVGSDPQTVFSVDLDGGDGDNDLAVVNLGSDNVSVLLNNGDGTFAPKRDYGIVPHPFSLGI